MDPHRLAYDADCGPCSRFKRVVGVLDSRRRIAPISLARADADGILDGVPASRRHSSFHLVAPDGQVLSGAAAIPALVRMLPGGRIPSLMLMAPGVPRAVRFVYQTLSRLHDSRSCALAAGGGSPASAGSGTPAVLRSSPGMPSGFHSQA